MKKSKYLDIIISEIEFEEEKENTKKKNKPNFLIKKVLTKILGFLSFKLFIVTIFILIIFLPILIILGFFASLWKDNDLKSNQSYYIEWDTFIWNFSQNNLDSPLWIPIERWIITYWYDYTKNSNPIINSFLRLFYHNSHEYYKWHKWLDFARTYQDKKDWYNPYILSTLRWIIKRLEIREEKGGNSLSYTRKTYSNWWILETYSKASKYNEWKLKPYGNHVIISSLDWKFYVMFAHLSEIHPSLFNIDKIWRWNILWRMWTTGNSTWVHLHYEIRYCWSNESINKTWNQCSSVNPLWTIIWEENTFLWFSTLPKTNSFYAGNFDDIKDNLKDEDEFNEEINNEYQKYCKNSELLFLWKNIKCKELFPIYYISKNSSSYPIIIDNNIKIEKWKEYIKEEYWISKTPTIDEISEIKKIENLKKNIYTAEELYLEIWNMFSLGKYRNNFEKYKIDITKESEEIMFQDLIETLDELKKKSDNIEELYSLYFNNTAYKKWENPYIYNMENKDKIFMDILDTEGNFISKYNKNWVLTIYRKLNQ